MAHLVPSLHPCQLSKILENVPGEDLDGDGEVTEQEIIDTRIRKGKEIFARTFLKENVRCGVGQGEVK